MQQEIRSPAAAIAPDATPSLPRNVRLLGLASLLNDIAGEMIFPLIPTFLITCWERAPARWAPSRASPTPRPASSSSGPAGCRIGPANARCSSSGYRWPPSARPFIGLATMPWQVLVVRMHAIGSARASARRPRDALVADSTDPAMRGRAFGFTRAMDHLGAAIGPLLAFAFLGVWPGAIANAVSADRDSRPVGGAAGVVRAARAADRHSGGERVPLDAAPFDRDFRVYLVALVDLYAGQFQRRVSAGARRRVGRVEATCCRCCGARFHIVKSAGSLRGRPGGRPLGSAAA